MTDSLFILITGILIIITSIAAYEYVKKIRQASYEYTKAKEFVEDIVLSFGRELNRESSKFDKMVTAIESAELTANSSIRKVERIESFINPIKDQMENLSKSYQLVTQSIEQLPQVTLSSNHLISTIPELVNKLKDIENGQETLKTRMTNFEENIQKIVSSPPTYTEEREQVYPPIPIRRDKALAALTDTEIQVLEMLSKEGSKTAPEIKERVHLSREHTARLMKKLYEDGYLEREAGKIPFRYSIKKEMEAILEKTGK